MAEITGCHPNCILSLSHRNIKFLVGHKNTQWKITFLSRLWTVGYVQNWCVQLQVQTLKEGHALLLSFLLPSGWIVDTGGTMLSHADEGNILGKGEQSERASLGPRDCGAAVPSRTIMLAS